MAKTIFDASRIDESLKAVTSPEDAISELADSELDSPAESSTFTDDDFAKSGTTSEVGVPTDDAAEPADESGSDAPAPARRKKHRRNPSEYSAVLREQPSSEGWIGSYVSQPQGMHFETQHEQEKILLVLRQHPIVFVPKLATLAALLLMPLFVFPMFPFFALLPPQMSFFSFVGWYVFVAIFAIESFLEWYYNIYVITDERIIDIDFYSLIYKSVSEAKISKIEDVTATTAGVIGATFNYGTITVQTAAEKREFEFAKVPRPATVTKLLNELILEEEREALEGRVM